MRIHVILVLGGMAVLAGCSGTDAGWAMPLMSGPCREVALQRMSDVKDGGFDIATQRAALSWTYKDCVDQDKRFQVYSSYDETASQPGS